MGKTVLILVWNNKHKSFYCDFIIIYILIFFLEIEQCLLLYGEFLMYAYTFLQNGWDTYLFEYFKHAVHKYTHIQTKPVLTIDQLFLL